MLSIVLLAKAPLLKKVKTRLALEIGDDLALKIYQQTLKKVIHEVSSLKNRGDLILAVTPDEHAKNKIWQGYGVDAFSIVGQGRGHLGERILHNIFQRLRNEGDKVVLLGSDVWGITQEIITELIAKLEEYDLVLAPAPDGGFGAIGTSTRFFNLYPHDVTLLNNVKWSTKSALKDTLVSLKKLSYFLSEEVLDIDDVTSLKKSPLAHLVKNA